MSDKITIVVPVGGATSDEYDSPAGWRTAIQGGDLRRDTVVTVYRGVDAQSLKAERVPELQPLFDEVLGAQAPRGGRKAVAPAAATGETAMGAEAPSEVGARAEDASPQPTTNPPGGESRRGDVAVTFTPEEPKTKAPQLEPVGSDEAAPAALDESIGQGESADPPKTPKPPANGFWIAGGVVVLALLLSRCFGGDPSPPEVTGSQDYAPAEPVADAVAQAPVETVGPTEFLFVIRTVNIRSGPSREAALMGELARGVELRGGRVFGDGREWLRIEDGPHAGGYVSVFNLGVERPPELAGLSRALVARDAAVVRAAPRSGARALGSLTAGESVTVVGVTEDDWAEILLPERGVGYVEMSIFQAGPEGYEDPPSDRSAPPMAPRPSPVCRNVTEVGRVATYCRDASGRWVQQGSSRSAPDPDRNDAAQDASAAAASAAAAAPPRLVTRFDWTRLPNPDQEDQAYPANLRGSGIPTSVRLDCGIDQAGRLIGCSTSNESPPGRGVAAAGLRLAQHYRVEAVDDEGFPTAGRRVRFVIRFE